jgi:hypothetical protein
LKQLLLPYEGSCDGSGVIAYLPQDDGITVEFRSRVRYVYTNASAGKANVAEMKRLAAVGKGLATFISQHVHERYARKMNGE